MARTYPAPRGYSGLVSIVMPELALTAHEVHVWWARPDSIATDEQRERCRALLPFDEQVQLDRFVLERSRHEYLAAHALVRTTLSRYAEVEPRRWKFRANTWGRPEIDEPSAAHSLRFNLSHTDDMVVCAVALERDVGVDVESLARRPATPDVAEHFFAPVETAALRALPASARPARFLEYWTLKEAYIKARGMGLAIPLDQFWFHFDGEAVELGVADGDDPGRWRFARFRPSSQHVLAVCVERGEHDAAIIVRETPPLGAG